MSETKLPIKVVLSGPEDHHKNDPGGSPKKVFGDVSRDVRDELVGQLQGIGAHFKSAFTRHPSVPAVAKVRLKDQALAKSHRPTSIFNSATCPIIGVRQFGELLIRVTPRGLTELQGKVRTDATKAGIAGISTIESIEPYTGDDALAHLAGDEFAAGRRDLKLRLFAHGDSEFDNEVWLGFESLAQELKISMAERIHYGGALRILKLAGVTARQAARLASYTGVQSVSGFPMYRIVKTAANIVRPLAAKDFPPPEPGRVYPVVGLIDTGANPNDPLLKPWVVDRHVAVPKNLQNNDHGSFVAGLLVHPQKLNHSDPRFPADGVKIVDVVAVPGSGSISEDDLLTLLEEVIPKYPEVKVWNLSLATLEPCRNVAFSDLGVAIDRLQEEHGVTFVVAAGNYEDPPARGWPSTVIGEGDRICAPADTVRGITVGSLAHTHNSATRVKTEEPSPFSRRGPGPMFVPKPDVVHYGGNCDHNLSYAQTGVLSIDGSGNVAENIGTSFAAPLVTGLTGSVRHALQDEPSRNLTKALIVHSAVLRSARITATDLRYRGFGVPQDTGAVLGCDDWCATLIFEPDLQTGYWFGRDQFPMPNCLRDAQGRLRGEIAMTLVYDPPLDANYGSEYCRSNVDASLGTISVDDDGVVHHKRQVPAQPKDINKLYERNLVEHGFKWSPVKVYRRSIPRGIKGDEWRLRMNVQHRQGFSPGGTQPAALVVSIFDPSNEAPVYDDVVRAMAQNGWATVDLRVRKGVRLRP